MREDEIPAIIEPVYLKQGGYAGIHFMSSMPMQSRFSGAIAVSILAGS
jgi:hypothetical protein